MSKGRGTILILQKQKQVLGVLKNICFGMEVRGDIMKPGPCLESTDVANGFNTHASKTSEVTGSLNFTLSTGPWEEGHE